MKPIFQLVLAFQIVACFSADALGNKIHELVEGGGRFSLACYLAAATKYELEDLIDEENDEGMSPLHLAVVLGNVKASELLLKYGADVYQTWEGKTAMNIATLRGELSILAVLTLHITNLPSEPLQFYLEGVPNQDSYR